MLHSGEWSRIPTNRVRGLSSDANQRAAAQAGASPIAAHAVLLDIITEPQDQHLKARQPMRMRKIGPVHLPSSQQFVGMFDQGIWHHNTAEGNEWQGDFTHHLLRYASSSTPRHDLLYLEVEGVHPTESRYLSLVVLLYEEYDQRDKAEERFPGAAMKLGREISEQTLGDLDGESLSDLMLTIGSQRFESCASEFRNSSQLGDLHADVMVDVNALLSIRTCSNGVSVKAVFASFERGWDGKERAVFPLYGAACRRGCTLNNWREFSMQRVLGLIDESTRMVLSIFCAAIFVMMILNKPAAAGKCMAILCLTFVVGTVLEVALVLHTFVIPSGPENFSNAIAQDANFWTRPAILLDTPEGAASRREHYQAMIISVICRLLHCIAMTLWGLACWFERHVLACAWIAMVSFFIWGTCVVPYLKSYVSWILIPMPLVGSLIPPVVWRYLFLQEQKFNKMVDEDMMQWREVEKRMMEQPDVQYHLDRLTALIKNTATSVVPRHAARGECTPGFDRLYLQAKTLVPYLSRLAQTWAYETNGIFRVDLKKAHPFESKIETRERGDGEEPGLVSGARKKAAPAPHHNQVQHFQNRAQAFRRWRDIREDVGAGSYLEGRPVFGRVKPIMRLMDKALRCYQGDVSRVCDMCRCAIAFESIAVS